MLNFKSYLIELIEQDLLEDFLLEAKDIPTKVGGASNNTKGVLHELLVGYHLQGGKHMENHHLINEAGKRESPKLAHDRLKSQIHQEDYKKIYNRAKSAADDIKRKLEKDHPDHLISHVHHTSKPGDTEKETGVKASQKDDSSDIYVHTRNHKTGEMKANGYSMKVSDKASKNIPSSSLGMESSGSAARVLFKKHQDAIKNMHPDLAAVSNKDKRKEWADKNPEHHAKIKSLNKTFLASVASAQAHELNQKLKGGNHQEVISHIRELLHAHKTPAEASGKATFHKHTTYETAKGTQHNHSKPGHDYEHMLSDKDAHKHIEVKSSGISAHFYYKGKKFASQSHKFDSQSDPLSTLKSAGKAV